MFPLLALFPITLSCHMSFSLKYSPNCSLCRTIIIVLVPISLTRDFDFNFLESLPQLRSALLSRRWGDAQNRGEAALFLRQISVSSTRPKKENAWMDPFSGSGNHFAIRSQRKCISRTYGLSESVFCQSHDRWGSQRLHPSLQHRRDKSYVTLLRLYPTTYHLLITIAMQCIAESNFPTHSAKCHRLHPQRASCSCPYYPEYSGW